MSKDKKLEENRGASFMVYCLAWVVGLVLVDRIVEMLFQ